MPIFEPMFAALNEAGVRYVIVGGVAVVLHGHPRLTADLDLAVDLEPGNARNAVDVLLGLGLCPAPPLAPEDFADATSRERWVRDKGMIVFRMADATGRRLVDLLADAAIPFAELWERSVEVPLSGTTVRVAAIPDLIRMKRLAGRPMDLLDIEVLETILDETGRGPE
jgi:predicted nucleotidyltransferase